MTDDPETAHGPTMDDSYGGTPPAKEPLEIFAEKVHRILTDALVPNIGALIAAGQWPDALVVHRPRWRQGWSERWWRQFLRADIERMDIIFANGETYQMTIKRKKP